MEGAAATVIEPGDKVIADVTGDDVFGPFIEAHGAKLIPLGIPPGTGANPDSIRSILDKEKNVKAIATCHNIAATSATNPIDEVGEIAAEYGCLLLVDVISSIGGMKIEMDKWNVDICCAATQKAFSVPAGVAIVAVGPRAWSVAQSRKTRIESEYFNLLRYKEAASPPTRDWHPTPDTCATTLVRALQQSMHDLLDEGLERVFHRHAVVAEAVREAVKAMGLELLVHDPRRYSSTVTAVKWPKQGDYVKFWRTMFDEFNIMLGNPPKADPRTATGWFRIGHMGNTARSEYILPTLSYVEIALRRAGLRADCRSFCCAENSRQARLASLPVPYDETHRGQAQRLPKDNCQATQTPRSNSRSSILIQQNTQHRLSEDGDNLFGDSPECYVKVLDAVSRQHVAHYEMPSTRLNEFL